MRLADETIDGIVFGMQLASNPKIKARREAYYAKLRAFREATAAKTKTEMIAELKARNMAYIVSILEAKSEADVRDRYAHTFGPHS